MPAARHPARPWVRLIVHALLITSLVSAFIPWQGRAAQSSGAETCKEGATELVKEAVFTALKNVGGEVAGFIDDLLLDPLIVYVTNPKERSFQAAGDEFVEGMLQQTEKVLKLRFPVYGLVVNGGRLIIGGSQYTVEQMVRAGREQQIEAIIFGSGSGGLLARFNNPLRDANFFSIGPVENKGITVANLGAKVTSSEQLRALWFTQYRSVLVNDLLFNKAEVDKALAEAWPRLEEFWRLKRAAAAIDSFKAELERQVRDAAKKAACTGALLYRGELPLRELPVRPELLGFPSDPSERMLIQTFSAEIRLDATSQPAPTELAAFGETMTNITGGAVSYRFAVQRNGETVHVRSFTSSQAEGFLLDLSTGAFGVIVLTGTMTLDLLNGRPETFNDAQDLFPLARDATGQLVLCLPGSIDFDGDLSVQQAPCLANPLIVLQPVEEEAASPPT